MTMIGKIRQYVASRLRPLPHEVVCTWRGLEIAVDPRTEIGSRLSRLGSFEAWEIDVASALFLGKYAGEGRCIIDVGANVGIHSLAWALAFDDTRVYAVEPAPATFEILRRNLERNGKSSRVSALRCALSNRAGDADFYVTEDDAFSSLKDTERKQVRQVIRVPVRTLDDLSQEIGGNRAGLIKIDVEGLETEVIAGGQRLLKRDRPVLFVEIYRGTNSNADPEGTIAAVRALGYEAFIFAPEIGLTRFVRHDDRFYNYFFLPLVTGNDVVEPP